MNPHVITYTDPEFGNLAVVHIIDGYDPATVAASVVPEGVPNVIMPKDQLPEDRYFRDAWKFDHTTGCTIDVEAAKEIQRNEWRKLRAPILEALDVEVLKAVERGDAKRRRELSDRKQALRDVTDIDLPDDLELIRNTIPDILTEQ
jgi:hypothetical protein